MKILHGVSVCKRERERDSDRLICTKTYRYNKSILPMKFILTDLDTLVL